MKDYTIEIWYETLDGKMVYQKGIFHDKQGVISTIIAASNKWNIVPGRLKKVVVHENGKNEE